MLTEPQPLGNAKTFGSLEKFKCGGCSFCQVGTWMDEEPLLSFEAMQTDAQMEDALRAIED